MTFATIAIDATFAQFGKPATYGNTNIPCTVIIDRADANVKLGSGMDSSLFAEGDVIEVRISEIATAPARQTVFTVNIADPAATPVFADYAVQADAKSIDPDRLVWTCSVTQVP